MNDFIEIEDIGRLTEIETKVQECIKQFPNEVCALAAVYRRYKEPNVYRTLTGTAKLIGIAEKEAWGIMSGYDGPSRYETIRYRDQAPDPIFIKMGTRLRQFHDSLRLQLKGQTI